MRKFILGILIGGLLLSGGWFAWGAIQQEVGISAYQKTTIGGVLGNSWQRVYNFAEIFNAGTTGLKTGALVVYPACNATASNTIKQCMSTGDFTDFTLSAGENLPIHGSILFATNGSTGAYPIRARSSNADGIAVDGLNYNLQTMSILWGYNGTDFDRLRSDITNGLDVDVTRFPNGTRSDTFTTTTSGTAVNRTTSPVKLYSLQVTGTATQVGTTTWDVRLECSLNGTTYTTVLTHAYPATADGATVSSGTANVPCLYMRSRTEAITLGTATNIVVVILGMV
jgi:hypothetical protein